MNSTNHSLDETRFTKDSSEKHQDSCKPVKISDLKHRIDKMVHSSHHKLSDASLLKLDQMKKEYESQKHQLHNQLQRKEKEIQGFSHELEGILNEMETIKARQRISKATRF